MDRYIIYINMSLNTHALLMHNRYICIIRNKSHEQTTFFTTGKKADKNWLQLPRLTLFPVWSLSHYGENEGIHQYLSSFLATVKFPLVFLVSR